MVIGIDDARAELVVGTRPVTERWSVPSDEEVVRTLTERLVQLQPELIVLEATGGYELLCVAALAGAGLPVAVVNPRQVRDFARATGQRAKTDQIDANVLALFADRLPPTVRALSDAAAQELEAVLARRRQLFEMLPAERNCLGQVFGRHELAVKKSLKAQIAFLGRELRRRIPPSATWYASRRPGASGTTSCRVFPQSDRCCRAPSLPSCPDRDSRRAFSTRRA